MLSIIMEKLEIFENCQFGPIINRQTIEVGTIKNLMVFILNMFETEFFPSHYKDLSAY